MGSEQVNYIAGWIPYLCVFLTAATISLVLLCIRAYFIGLQLERFIKGTEAQIAKYLGEHQQWTDVATLALQTFPNLIQGGVQLALSLQDLMYNINRAGGIAKVVDTIANNSKRDAPEVVARGGRKPRIVQQSNISEAIHESGSSSSGD